MIGGDDEVKEAGGGLCPDEEVELFLWAVEKTRDKEEKVGLVLFCLQRLVEALPCNTMRKQVLQHVGLHAAGCTMLAEALMDHASSMPLTFSVRQTNTTTDFMRISGDSPDWRG